MAHPGMYMRPGQQPPPSSDHYGAYGQQFASGAYQISPWQALGFNTGDELQALFESKKSPLFNGIQSQELFQIMNESERIRNYYKIHWSRELCIVMLSMLDRSKDGIMQYPEFCELLQCITFWYNCFCQYDMDRSGYIEQQELTRVIYEKFSYRLSSQAMTTIFKRYSRAMEDGRLLVSFDDFVACCVRLRAYTEAFRARDRQVHGGYETGSCAFSYDDFLQCVMCL